MKSKGFLLSDYEVGKIGSVLCLVCLFLLIIKELWGFSLSTVLILSEVYVFFLFVFLVNSLSKRNVQSILPKRYL
jgi:hypothetical protein